MSRKKHKSNVSALKRRVTAQGGKSVDATSFAWASKPAIRLRSVAMVLSSVNKRPKVTPPSLGGSIAKRADRLRDPTPIYTGELLQKSRRVYLAFWLRSLLRKRGLTA